MIAYYKRWLQNWLQLIADYKKWLQIEIGNDCKKWLQIISKSDCKLIANWKVIVYCKWLHIRGHEFFKILLILKDRINCNFIIKTRVSIACGLFLGEAEKRWREAALPFAPHACTYWHSSVRYLLLVACQYITEVLSIAQRII